MLSLKTRLECTHSYATEESIHLLCDYDGVCDGELYECCFYDKNYNETLELIAEDNKKKGGEE